MLGAGGGFGSARERRARVTGPGAGQSPRAVHYPYVRPLQLEWQELPTGFRARSNDPYRFEVICAACGDIDGPLEYQSYAAQQLRGPYESKHLAEKVSQRHHVGSTFAAGRDNKGKRAELRYMMPIFPMRTSRDRSRYIPPASRPVAAAPRDRSGTWHQVLWVRLQARWIRWRR